MDAAEEMRAELNAEEKKVSVTGLLIKAAGLALEKHPRVNAQFRDGSIALNERCNVGVAVAVEDGLFVPVVRDAEARGIAEISSDLKELAASAREGTLIPEQYEGGSLTLSNLGMFDVDYFLPIINPPESCILGIGKLTEEVVAHDGAITIEKRMKVSLSADHRVVDGAEAAKFFKTFQELLENPESLVE
jgi:pyruvate dehydrogenase E2 component (dihydrolipoamide acetyltransferase)